MTHSQFNTNYQEYFNAMLNFANKLTRDKNDAEELVQIAAIKAYKGLHTFKSGTSFKSWAFTILKNAFITNYNKKRRRNTVSTPVEEMQFTIDRNYSVANPAESNMRMKEINECIETLSYKSKMPFLLHIEGYQYDEIAEALNIPIGTVKSRINFARTKLKTILKDRNIIAA